MKKEFELLKNHFGTHGKVARQLGVSPRQYQRYRYEGRVPAPIQKLVKLLVEQLRIKIS